MVFSFIKNLLGGSERADDEPKPVAEKPRAAAPRPSHAAPPESADSDDGFDNANIESFVRFVTQALVDHPEDISLEKVDKGRNTTINITCAKSDMGKIIGRNGKTISAIRALAAGAAGKAGKKVSVEVLD
jgi:predicted RNA-binding protein YlqC (UPF0109 family)